MSEPKSVPWERFGVSVGRRWGTSYVTKTGPWRLELERTLTRVDARVLWRASVMHGPRIIVSTSVAGDRPEMAIRKADKALDELQSALEALKGKP